MDKMSSKQRRRPPYGQPKGSCSINMPWVIPPWLALVKFLGLTSKEYDKHDDDKSDNVDNDGNNSNGPQPVAWGLPPPPTTSSVDNNDRSDPGVPGGGSSLV
jgi:hypothetical protein